MTAEEQARELALQFLRATFPSGGWLTDQREAAEMLALDALRAAEDRGREAGLREAEEAAWKAENAGKAAWAAARAIARLREAPKRSKQ